MLHSKNLQELVLACRYDRNPYPFDDLRVTTCYFSTIKSFEDVEMLIKFFKRNGKNLEELVCDGNSSLYLAVTKFCPNLQSSSPKRYTLGG